MKYALLVVVALQIFSAYATKQKTYTGKCSEETWVPHKSDWQHDFYEKVWYLREMLDFTWAKNDNVKPICGKINRYEEYFVDMMTVLLVYKDFTIQNTRILTLEEKPEAHLKGVHKIDPIIKSVEIGEESEPASFLEGTDKKDLDSYEVSYGRWPHLDAEAAVWWNCVADDDFVQPDSPDNTPSDNFDTRFLFTRGPFTEWESIDGLKELIKPGNTPATNKFEGNLYTIKNPEACTFREFH